MTINMRNLFLVSMTLLVMTCCRVANAQPIFSPEFLDDKKLEDLVELISGQGRLAYPINTIRISNRFVRAGKTESLRAIRSFLDSNSDSEVNLDAATRALIVLIPILFPMESQTELPMEQYVNRTDVKWKAPFDECVVIGGIPLDFYGHYAGGRGSVQINDILEWLGDHGVFRSEELEPISNPAQLTTDIEQSGIFVLACQSRGSNGQKTIRKLIRWQILSLIEDSYEQEIESIVLARGGPWSQCYDSDSLLDSGIWSEKVESSKSKSWNGLLERYVEN